MQQVVLQKKKKKLHRHIKSKLHANLLYLCEYVGEDRNDLFAHASECIFLDKHRCVDCLNTIDDNNHICECNLCGKKFKSKKEMNKLF